MKKTMYDKLVDLQIEIYNNLPKQKTLVEPFSEEFDECRCDLPEGLYYDNNGYILQGVIIGIEGKYVKIVTEEDQILEVHIDEQRIESLAIIADWIG